MKTTIDHAINFNGRTFLKAAVPSYVLPTLMSFTAGYLRHDSALMQASYTAIAIPSLVSALLSYALLWQLEIHQLFIPNKVRRTILVSMLMLLVGLLFVYVTGLRSEAFNICSSAFLGAALTTWNQPITKVEK